MHVNLRGIQTHVHYRMWRMNVLFDRLSEAMTPSRFIDVAAFCSSVLLAVCLPPWNFLQVLATIGVFWTGAKCFQDARDVWRTLKK